MNNKYKIVISNRNLYREIELPVDAKTYKVGTSIDCDFRIHKELFFEEIQLIFTNNNHKWSVMCSDNTYITIGDTRRLFTKELEHGDNFIIKYQESNNYVFNIEFTIDFDSKNTEYERKIEIGNKSRISIGASSENNIVLKSDYIIDDKIELVRNNTEFILEIKNTTYGVYHNGRKVTNEDIIKDGDFISISDFMFYYKDNSLWTEISENCDIKELTYSDYRKKNNYPIFVRNTRVKIALNEEVIEILDPPNKPEKPKNNIVMNLLPSMGMLIASGAMAFMGGAMIIFSAISGIMAIVTSILGIVQGNKDYKKEIKERIEKYNNYIDNKRKEIEKYREEEKQSLEKIYISKEEKMRWFREFSSDLFDRRPDDEDFLEVRLGTGSVEAVRKINYKKQERLEIEDELQELPERICAEHKMINEAPIVCNFKKVDAIGVTGDKKNRREMLKTMVTDICARQFYSEVKIFIIANEENAEIIHTLRYLPHIESSIGDFRNVVCDEESKKNIFELLYNVLTNREQRKKFKEHFVVFFYDLCGFASHPISRFVDNAKDLGVTFIFFADEKKVLPLGCDEIIAVLNDEEAELLDTKDAENSTVFRYDTITDYEMSEIIQIITAIKTEEISLEGSLTKNISLFSLLNILGVDDLNLKKRWADSKVYDSMAVPLGVSKTGVIYLDLHDKEHGPHGLVAGTTGSGKSEILQTYILSIATYFNPYEVAFVIIDFKGGGMVNQFKELPHLLGAITNIDGKEIDRSLKSIKAELQKRQRLFAEVEVNHIDKYIKKFKSNEAKIPLPHLIIIVDEFAELKAEQPEFMKELISAARIGRSLGVHLILATQKPSGQVDEQIWSNSRFKLCLKVQGPEDSNEVLKSPLAAEIKEPGRAYLQVGNNEVFELFQSAYSGETEKAMDNSVKAFKVSKVETSGKRTIIYEQKKQKTGEQGRTQLEAVVDYVSDYCNSINLKRLPSICIESMGKSIDFIEDNFEIKNPLLDIGIYDDPDNQYQGSTFIDVDNKNTFIIGSPQYGKTNIIQLMIREITMKYSPKEANIYILDFGSMVLKNFESLNHVGGVVCSSDDEKLKNLFKLLQEEIASRKEKLVSVGVSSFAAYCEAGYKDLPHIYVLVDNMTALMELYLENDDTFLVIIREGLSVGITVIVANSQTSGIGYKYLSNFANKISLYCNDSNEYGNIFDHVTLKPDDIPGRCIIEIDKRILECQTYLAFKGEKEYERVTEIKKYIEECNSKYISQKAKSIPFIPNVLYAEALEEDFDARKEIYTLPMGLSYSDVSPFYLDFSKLGAIGICGKEKKGHYNFISSVLYRLNEYRENNPVRVCIFDDISRKYKDLSNLEIIESYSLNTDEVIEKLSEWNMILESRYQAMLEESVPEDNELLMLIIQNNDVAKKIFEDMDAMNQYTNMVSRYKALNICVIYANYDNASVSYDAPEPLRMVKQEQHLIYFDDLDNLKVFDVPYEELRANKKKLQLGDAYYINDNSVTKVKLIKR
ncbi:MAG: type VII secretion protein EssC [Clostridium sp.]